jgi:UDP-glucose 4-epimerase
MSEAPSGAELLQIYLEDHLVGATAGVARAHRLAEAERDSLDGPTLAEFADDVDADREALLALMKAAESRRARSRTGLPWSARSWAH